MFGRAQLSRRLFRIWRYTRRLGVRATALAGIAIFAALTSPVVAHLVPDAMVDRISMEAVSRILQVLAASMLSVTIFSLSVLVSARQAAASQVTPRSHQILLEDMTTQYVLATFLGSFIFALTALIAIDTGYYPTGSAPILLLITVAVTALVVFAILRWIDHLSELGSVGKTLSRIEQAAARAARDRRILPCLGAKPLTPGQLEIPARAERFTAWDTGYVQHIDLRGLNRHAASAGGSIFVVAQPGELVSPGDALLYHTMPIAPDKLRAAFSIADARVFEQDPRFGVIVLSEVAQRALSPGVNDPGTAIDVLTRLARVLAHYRAEANADCPPELTHVWMSPITPDELMRDAFDPIARDGAGVVEVQIRLQKTLALLSHSGDNEMENAAKACSVRALAVSAADQMLPEHRARLQELAEAV